MEQNLHSEPQLFNHQGYSNESNALSINSNAEIEEPKDDEFFDAAKKNVIKKLDDDKTELATLAANCG